MEDGPLGEEKGCGYYPGSDGFLPLTREESDASVGKCLTARAGSAES